MTLSEELLTIGVITAATVVTRFLPFVLFPPGKKRPNYVRYLGQVLPPAALGILVVYCFKDIDLFSGAHGIPEIIAALFVIALHLWRRMMLLSIAGGTILYMLLIQFVF